MDKETMRLLQVQHAAEIIQTAVTILYNSGPDGFKEIFGEKDGPNLFLKYRHQFDDREGDFICYLDGSNKKKLATAVLKKINPEF